MKKVFPFLAIISFLLLSFPDYAQTVYEPLSSSVYGFLERMDLKGSIVIHDEVKPFSRTYIAGKLRELENNRNALSAIDKDELEFYRKEYAIDLYTLMREPLPAQLSIFHKDVNGRFRALTFTHSLSLFTFMADPILKYSVSDIKGDLTSHLQNGAKVYGYISDNIGFSVNYSDNTESGPYLDYTKNFTPVPGIVHTGTTAAGVQNLQYDEVNADVSINWKWGTFTFAKDYLN